MTADSFLDYLEHPSHLYQISYQELKSLVVQYPYCQNLRYLLLKKSQLENHRDLNRNLSLAATYAADRSRLFQLSHKEVETEEAIEFLDLEALANQAEKETVLAENASFDFVLEESQSKNNNLPSHEISTPSLKEDTEENHEDTVVFELPLLDSFSAFDTVAETQEESEIQEEVKQETAIPMNYPNSFKVYTWLSERSDVEPRTELDEIDAEIAAAMERLAAQQNGDDTKLTTEVEPLEKASRLEAAKKESETSEILARPEPKVSFSSWLSQFKAPVRRGEGKGYDVLLTPLDLDSPLEKRKKKKKKKRKPKKEKEKNTLHQMLATKQKAIKKGKKKKKKNRIVAKAVMSLVESEDLVSETLANILVEQERYKKAIKMYKRLSLKFPEKNAYFASKIEKIKKLM